MTTLWDFAEKEARRSKPERQLHPKTHAWVVREYSRLCREHPSSLHYQQVYNTLVHNAPNIRASIAEMYRASQQFIADMRKYPEEAYLFMIKLDDQEEFNEIVQETSARLHNREAAKWQTRPIKSLLTMAEVVQPYFANLDAAMKLNAYSFGIVTNVLEGIRLTLEVGVPLKIADLQALGGPQDYHIEDLQRRIEATRGMTEDRRK